MFATAGMLGHAGACVQWHLAPGVGHGIDPIGLEMGGGFLGMAFRQQLRRRIPEVNCPLGVT